METFTQNEGWWRGYQKQPLSPFPPSPSQWGKGGQLSSWYKSAVLRWFTPAEHLASRHFRSYIKRTAMWCAAYKSLSWAKAVVLTCVLLGYVTPWCPLPSPEALVDTTRPAPGHYHLGEMDTGQPPPSCSDKMEAGARRGNACLLPPQPCGED